MSGTGVSGSTIGRAVSLALLVSCGRTGSASEASASREPSSLGARASAPAVVLPATSNTISVASYNINFGNGHSTQTVDVIATLDTDIILLQETTEASEMAIRQRLDEEYYEIRFHHCCRAGGLGILSRFEVLDAEVVETDIGFFPAWWLRLKTPYGPLVIVDVHLRPPISDGGSWVVGFFTTRAARAREMAALWLDLPKGEPMLIAGDFNEPADGDVVKFLRSEGMEASLPQFVGNEPTWHWPVGATDLRMQLDHIVYGPPMTATAARIVRGGLSDHEPVVVELSLAE